MKKTFNKIIIFLLCFITLFATACGRDNGGNNIDEPQGGNTVAQTEFDLVANGASSYKVVIPDAPRDYEEYAGEELVSYFYKATMVELPLVNEKEVSYTEDSKLIIVGETNLAKTAGVTAIKSEYGVRGFVIKAVNSNVFVVGGDTTGTLYAVYEFLHQQFGFEAYGLDEEYIDTGVQNEKLLALDMKEIPDVAHVQGIGPFWKEANKLAGHKLRYQHYNEIFIHATGQPWHNTSEYVSPSEYGETHPKWFVQAGGTGQELQIHYTAHGDDEELEALRDVVFNRMVAEIEEDFEQGMFYEYIGFMHNDSGGTFAQNDGKFLSDNTLNRGKDLTEEQMLENDSVLKLKAKYGESEANAAMLIQFINPVAKRLKQYMAENWGEREMNITIFAYMDTEAAPVKNQNGKWVPIDEDVIVEPNVNVFMAYIRDQYTKDWNENNMSIVTEKWKAICSQTSFWFYDYYWGNEMILMDNIYSLQSYFRACRDAKAKYVFNESNSSDVCSFQNIKVYLTSKLTWDAELNVEELLDDYFNNWYKGASKTMRKYFDELMAHYAYLKSYTDFTGQGSISSVNDDKYWPLGVVSGFMDYINQAYKDIEPLKTTDPATYAKLSKRIMVDSFMPRYIILSNYGAKLYDDDESFNQAVNQLKAELNSLGIRELDSVTFSR